MVDKRKVERGAMDVRKKCTKADGCPSGARKSPIICLGVDGRKYDTLAFTTDLRRTQEKEYHLIVTDERSGTTSYVTHLEIPDDGKNTIGWNAVYRSL